MSMQPLSVARKSPPENPTGCNPWACLLSSLLLRANVKAEQQLLVAQVEAAVGDHRLRPDLGRAEGAAHLGHLRLLRDREAAVLLPGLRVRLEQYRLALVAVQVEHAV